MQKIVIKYGQIVVVSVLFFFIIYIKNKITIDDDAMNFLTDTFTSPVVDQGVKKNIKNRLFKDGTYTGDSIDAYYGFLQLEVVIINKKIDDIIFLSYPSANLTSDSINGYAASILKSEAIQIQDSNVDIVSGASNSSRAFRKSLESALAKAQ